MMQEIRVQLTEPEMECLKEMAHQAGISVEEAARRAIRYAIKEVVPINSQFYQRLRSQMFWEHDGYLNSVLRRNGGGQ
jgi:hypothetical protein